VVAVEADDDPLRPLPADLAERATVGLTRILACRDAVQSWDPTTESASLDPSAPSSPPSPSARWTIWRRAWWTGALGDTDRRLVVGTSAEVAQAALTSAHRTFLSRVRPEVKAAEMIRLGGESARARAARAVVRGRPRLGALAVGRRRSPGPIRAGRREAAADGHERGVPLAVDTGRPQAAPSPGRPPPPLP
jgi:hypothetical protein